MPQIENLAQWVTQIDQYQQVKPDGTKIGKDLTKINALLPVGGDAREKLNTGTHDGSTQARIEFLTFLHNKILIEPDKQAKNASPIEIKELLGEHGMNLYKAAINEERNSQNFREAVFVNSCNHYEGLKWEKKMVLWVGGPSASGKSFGAQAIINQVEYKMPKEIANAKAKKDTTGKILISAQGSVEYEYDEPGNDVISIDGGIEREVSQMRQMLLQVALSKGYIGVENLDKTKLNTKKYVQKAAETTDNLSMVIPNTFANPFKKRKNKLRMASFEDNDNIEQFFSIVDGEKGLETQFQDTVFHSGTTRAWYDPNTQGNFEPTKIKMNNTNIGCESKVYDPNPFSRGQQQSKKVMAYFERISHVPDSHTITFTTDLVHIYQNPNNPNKWKICPTNEKPTHKMSKRDFTNFKIFLHDPELWAQQSDAHQQAWDLLQAQENNQNDPDVWLKACRKNGIASQPIIKTKAELKTHQNPNAEISAPKPEISRRHSFSGGTTIKLEKNISKRDRSASSATNKKKWHAAAPKKVTDKPLFDISLKKPHQKTKVNALPEQTQSKARRSFTKQHSLHKTTYQDDVSAKLCLASITDAAQSDLQNNNETGIQSIQTFTEKTGNIHRATIAFKGTTDKPVETYAQETNDDNIQLSIQKNALPADQVIAIKALCSLAVKTANKNTVFNIPESLDVE